LISATGGISSGAAMAADQPGTSFAQGIDSEPSSHGSVVLRGSGIYIVQLAEAPVAKYEGDIAGLPAAKRIASRGGKLDARSNEAEDYASFLKSSQLRFVQELNAAAGDKSAEPVGVLRHYQHAFNGLALKLTDAQLAAARKHPSVRLIEPLTAHPLLTDIGPGFIGAPDIWSGTGSDGVATRGEGVVIGVIDSGVNWPHPSFAATDGDGYVHTNPNGAGNYIGICDGDDPDNPAPDPLLGPACNDKLFGAWDMAFDLVSQINDGCTAGTIPASTCSQLGVPLTDFPNALDENGHGSHTAGTAGGNRIDTGFVANTLSVSGVAPRANLVVYDTCHTNTNGQGSCLNVATLAAIEQAVIDGVDVINYSIGGGNQPWTEAGAQAFLAAEAAGIVIAASAGNSGPTASSVGHREPWVMTVASGTHQRGQFGGIQFSLTGPGTPPPGTVNQPILLGTAGILSTPALPPGTPIIVSPNLDDEPQADGCSPYAPNTFQGAFALIRRGTCSFSQKVQNAEAAGAIGMIIANNQTGDIAPGLTPGQPVAGIPAFGLTQARANEVRDFIAGLGDPSEAAISIQGSFASITGDVMSGFSSRGPSAFEMIKPDILGPGSQILAAYVGAPAALNAISGTSMSSPHLAGSAALLRALKPSWTPSEIKSALMMTSKSTGILKSNGGPPADPFDRGAGRVDLSVAARAGLVMHETQANYSAANPAQGGNVSALNIPSLKAFNCTGSCSFTRTVRSTVSQPQHYTFDATTPTGISIDVTPSEFTMQDGDTQVLTITVNVDNDAAAMGVWNFAELRIEPSVLRNGHWISQGELDAEQVQGVSIPTSTLHLPVAVRPFAALPVIGVTPTEINETAAFGAPAFDVPLTVSNSGNASLNWAVDSSGECGAAWISVDPDADVVAPAGSSSVEVSIDPSGLAVGSHEAKICLESDDSATPVVEVPVTLEITVLDDEIFFDGFEAL